MNGKTDIDQQRLLRDRMGSPPRRGSFDEQANPITKLRHRMGTGAEAALRGAEAISAQPMPIIRLHTGKIVGGEAPEEPTPITLEESIEFALRKNMPSFLNEQLNEFYEHPERIGLEIGATYALPELAYAKLAIKGATVPGRIAIRSASGALSGFGASLAAETFDPTENPLSHALTVAAYSAMGEAAGEIFATGANTLLARGRRMEPGAREAFEQLRGRGVPSPGQLSKSPWTDVIENITHSTVFGHAPIEEMREAAEAAALLDVERFIAQFVRGEGAETVGGTLTDAIELSNEFYKRAGDHFYNVLWELANAAKIQAEVTGRLAEGAGISSTRLLKAAHRVAREGKRSPTAQKAAQWVIDEVGDNPSISLREAHSLRADLRTIVPPPDEPLPPKAKSAPVHLISVLTQEIKRHALELGADVAKQLDVADTYWSALHEVFGDRFIRGLLKAEPETVLKKVTPPEMPGTVRRIREIILDPNITGVERAEAKQLWEQVEGHVMMRIARQAEDADLEVIGKTGLKGLRRYWDDTLDELFPVKQGLETFKSLLNTLKITQGGIGEGLPGGIATRLLQAGILFNAAPEPGRIARLFVPVFMMKRLFTNESFVRWAIIGSKAPPGSFQAIRAFTKMESIFAAEQTRAEREQAMIDSVKRTQAFYKQLRQ